MKKKLTLGLAMLMAASMALTGCASESKTDTAEPTTSTEAEGTDSEGTDEAEGTDSEATGEQVLHFNLGADPLTLDPQLNSAVDGGHVINNAFEGLMRELDGEIVPAMAEKVEVSEDNLVYTFTLRDAKWSDGKPVTANDFEFAWKRGADPATASEYMYIFDSANLLNAGAIGRGEMSIDELGVKAIDEKTLQVTLSRPTDYFLEITSFASLMPVRSDVVDNEGAWAKDPAKYIGNGPFKMKEYKMGDRIVFEKNDNYWNAAEVNLEEIVMYMIVDESTAHAKYNSNELHINELIPTNEIPTLIAEDPTFYITPQIGTYYFAYNMNNEALKDANVRKALSMAIDREQIVKNVTKGGQKVAYGYMPEGITDDEGNSFTETAGDYGVTPTGNVEAAKALLKEAGYEDGAALGEIEILYNTSEAHKSIAESIQEMLKQNLGVNIKLTNQEWAVFQETTNNNEFEGLARRGWLGDYNDPQTMLEIFESDNPQNIGRYASEAFDAEMDLSREAVGAERMDHLYKAHDILMDDMPIIPLYYYVSNMMVKDEVQDLEVTALNKFWFGDVEIVEVTE